MNSLKQFIKTTSARQIELKAQRKTVNLAVERTTSPQQATTEHLRNREVLRDHYIAYAILRGKDPKLAVASFDAEKECRWITKIVDRYAPEFVRPVHPDGQ